MSMKRLSRLIVAAFLSIAALSHVDAADIRGAVTSMQVKPGSNQLWFTIAPMYGANLNLYCQSGWAGLTMYIPTSDPDYPYYYGLLLTSLTKNLDLPWQH